ncbi:hypothetical protein BC826DRAFT_1030372 [Russula brevipes]|nr:hypothetical protein BC826DRAFT_1030372 [Russula brevipes]
MSRLMDCGYLSQLQHTAGFGRPSRDMIRLLTDTFAQCKGSPETVIASLRVSSTRAGPGGHACVVLMDELDQLMTAKLDVVYNFFNWPTLAGAKLVVLAVANTMDPPERVMTGRVGLVMVRINFQPYTTPQLEQIVHAGLGRTEVLSGDAAKFAAMEMSIISGDARRVLEICGL